MPSAAQATSVGSPSVFSVSSTAAGASDVTYVAQFTPSPTGGLAADSGTFTLTPPAGTSFGGGSFGNVDVFDVTADQDLGPASPTAADTWRVSQPVPAGHTIQVALINSSNPAAGSYQIGISTSSDTTVVQTPAYSITAPQAVASPSLISLSSSAGSATGVTYHVEFTTSSTGELEADSGRFTLTPPAGTTFGGGSFGGVDVYDVTAGQDLGDAFPSATDTWVVSQSVPAGHTIQVALVDSTNPAPGSYQIAVQTSSDPTATQTSAYSITTPQAVSSPSLATSTTTADATGVTYVVQFRTSFSGGLDPAGQITLTAPTGTVFGDTDRISDVFDETAGQDLGPSGSATTSNGGATATWTLGTTVFAGHTIRLTITGTTNPAAGSYQLGISTSSDSVPTQTSAYSITAPQTVVSPAVVSLSSSAAGATGVTYVVQFTTSGSGALGPASQITLTGPAGTSFGDAQGISDVFDVTANQDLGASGAATTANGGATATWTSNLSIPANHTIRLVIGGSTNPTVGSYQLGISTSSDATQTQTPAYAVTTPQPIASPTVSLSTTAAGVPGVTYTVQFTTSSSGDLEPGAGQITIAAPAGSVMPSGGIGVFDVTANQPLDQEYGETGAASLSNGGATATWTLAPSGNFAVPIPAGHVISLTIAGVTNPAGGAHTLGVSTSSDQAVVQTPSYSTTPPQAVGAPVLASLSSSAAGATGVTYTVQFTTSTTGDLEPGGGQITLTAPAGTVFGGGTLGVFDVTAGVGIDSQYFETSPPTLSDGGATATWTLTSAFLLGEPIPAGHVIRLTVSDVTNPAAGVGNITVSTSSDPAATQTPSYGITASEAVSAPSLTLSSTATDATGVSYTVAFATSSSGELEAGSGQITITAPPGTVLPQAPIDVYDVSAGQDLGSTGPAALSNAGAMGTWSVAQRVPAGDLVRLTISGVTNPPAGYYTLGIATSSDAIATATPSYSIGPAPDPISPPTITGSAVEGETLTEVHGAWTNSPSSYAYQWSRCDAAGTSCAAIPAATGQTYVLGADDVGDQIEVEETASDISGPSGPATSAPTSAVISPPPENTAAPQITGAPVVGDALTEVHGEWTNAPTLFAYQWLRCTGPAACLAIAGATGQAYDPVPADAGLTLAVVETASNAAGPGAPATSANTAVVLPPVPIDTSAPTISGTPAESATLTETNGTWTNGPTSYSYQWLQCSSLGDACQPISGATSQTYVPGAADVGQTIAVGETAANAGGAGAPARSQSVGPIVALAAVPSGGSAGARQLGPAAPSPGPAPRQAPSVRLSPDSSSTTTGATFVGVVSPPQGSSSGTATYFFEYGTTQAYGSQTPTSTVALRSRIIVRAAGTSSPSGTIVRATVGGLLPYTTYHYRLVAADCPQASCTARSADQSVTTASSLVPVVGHTVGVAPVSGTIRVRLRGSRRFVALRVGEVIPLGTTVDATHGTVVVISATTTTGTHDVSGQFSQGSFTITQPTRAFTVLDLDSSFAACPRGAGMAAAASIKRSSARPKSRRTVNQVFGNAHGAFKTRGRYATAADEGTKWLTADRCDGTLVEVIEGTIQVTDSVHHRTLTRHAGQSYLS